MVEDCIVSHSLSFSTPIKILIKTYGCMNVAFFDNHQKFERQKIKQRIRCGNRDILIEVDLLPAAGITLILKDFLLPIQTL